jgi:acyl-CoA thioesterase
MFFVFSMIGFYLFNLSATISLKKDFTVNANQKAIFTATLNHKAWFDRKWLFKEWCLLGCYAVWLL